MRLASYIGTRPGLQGLGNRIIRARLDGDASHSELVFMPGDGVDEFMPDGSCEPVDGAYWAASSVAFDRLPEWSHRRKGEIGGVRFKRIKFDPARWELDSLVGADPLAAAIWFTLHEGELYDWALIAKFIAFFMPERDGRHLCGESIAAALGFEDAWRFDPCTLRAAARRAFMGV